MLTDEHYLLHAVAPGVVPVAQQSWFAAHKVDQFFLFHRGIPQSCLAQRLLYASLFEEERHVCVVGEVADALGTDDVLGPLCGDEVVELVNVERFTAVVDVGADAIFFHLAAFMVVMVVVMMVVVFLVFVIVVVVIVVIIVVMVFVFVVMMVFIFIFIVVLFDVFLELFYPCCRGDNVFKVEHSGAYNLVEVDVGIVAVDDFGLGLQRVDDLSDASKLLLLHLRLLVKQDDVAEFDLLYDEVFDVFFVDVLTGEAFSAVKLALKAQCIGDVHHAVEAWYAVSDVFLAHAWHRTDGLCDGFGLAYSAGFDGDIVESVHLHDVGELCHEVHLQRAADAAILQCHEAVVALSHHASFLYERGIDIHFADVVYDDGKLNVPAVGENAVEQRGLAAAEIACDEQYWSFFHVLTAFFNGV